MVESDYEELRAALGRALASPAGSYEELAGRALRIRSMVAGEIGAALTDSINAEAAQRPQDSLAEKRDLASWINHELRQLGLTLAFPGTGRPAILTATPGRRDADEGSRFRLEAKDEHGRRVMSGSLGWVPKLELIESPLRPEGGARHR